MYWQNKYLMGKNLDLGEDKIVIENNVGTEIRNPDTMDIDLLGTRDMLKKINNEDKKVAYAVEKEIPNIARSIDEIEKRIRNGGRLFYIGSGTSGRIGILDASECPPTFGTDPDLVQGIIAGGDRAIRFAIEGAEDNKKMGKVDLMNKSITKSDSIIGLATSGRTPYVLGAMEYSKSIGAFTIGLCCTENSPMEKIADIMIRPIVGPEAIAGSTRMKAGTSQKLVLNMISTGVMIKLGKVYSNLMVNVQATNEKLMYRAKNIVKTITNEDETVIEQKLKENNYDVRMTILVLLTKMDREEIQEFLNGNKNIRKALGE